MSLCSEKEKISPQESSSKENSETISKWESFSDKDPEPDFSKKIVQKSFKLKKKGISDYLTVYALPVSGSNFPAQLAAISEIHAAHCLIHNNHFTDVRQYQPDLLLGASGGAMSSYVGMAGNWSYSGICRVLQNVHPEILCMSWWPPLLRKFLPSWLLWFFQGSMYRNGKGAEDIFDLLFTPKSVQRSEIWINVYDSDKFKSRLFCNRSKAKSIIREPEIDKLDMKGCSRYEYLKGNLNCIAQTVIASCSIPGLVSKKKYRNSQLIDGGVMFASPLSCMSDEIYDIVRRNSVQLRLFYIASYPMDSPTPTPSSAKGVQSDLLHSIEQIMHSQALMDRTYCLHLLNCLAKDRTIHKNKYRHVQTKRMAQIIRFANTKSHYVLIFYPYERCSLNLTNFEPHQAIACMDKVKKEYMVDLWYIN